MKLYLIKGYGANSTCKRIQPNLKYMGITMVVLGLTLTTTHELANMAYIVDSLAQNEAGRMILQNEQLTKLFLDSPIVKEWISKPDMVAQISDVVKELMQSVFVKF